MIDEQKILNWPFKPVEHAYTSKDSILYALGVGLGGDPLDAAQLRFLFEEQPGFAALPTMAVVLAGPGFWVRDPDSGVDWKKGLHGEQGMELHAPLPAEATVIGQTRVREISDKGEGKGALLYIERTLTDKATGAKLATLTSTTFARGDGGFGGTPKRQPKAPPLPDRAPDMVNSFKTLPQSALIYRLSGDPNPLHASPEVAAAAGFKAPILHGLCSYAVAGLAILRECCASDPARLKAMSLRFSSPVYPGETIRTEIWDEGAGAFAPRAGVAERDVTVLDQGRATVAAA